MSLTSIMMNKSWTKYNMYYVILMYKVQKQKSSSKYFEDDLCGSTGRQLEGSDRGV